MQADRPGGGAGSHPIVTGSSGGSGHPRPPGAARFGERRAAGLTSSRFKREWRNRQTRTVQVRVSERTWGFNSPLAHVSGPGDDLGLYSFPELA